MRQIKFRAKDLEGHWICGYYTQGYIHVDNSWRDGDQGEWWGIPVDENTVGQFTGLTDKNGKEIYEGDIVKEKESEYSNEYRVYSVYFNEDEMQWWMSDDEIGDSFPLIELELDYCKVIGNIHDNPDLLTK